MSGLSSNNVVRATPCVFHLLNNAYNITQFITHFSDEVWITAPMLTVAVIFFQELSTTCSLTCPAIIRYPNQALTQAVTRAVNQATTLNSY